MSMQAGGDECEKGKEQSEESHLMARVTNFNVLLK